MPKKRAGMLGRLWNAWVWVASGFLNIFYLLARFIIWAAVALRKILAARERLAKAGRPHAGATYQPLVLQKQLSGNLSEFEGKILSSKSTIGLILGARGSGKSAIGMRILENLASKSSRKVCAMGFEESALPDWIRTVRSVEEVANGSFVLIDEGGITFSSRASQSPANKILSSLLLVARHKDLSVLFISQNSANLEINTIRQADYLLMRKPSLLQKEFERKKIGQIYDEISGEFAGLADGGRHSTYIYSDEFRGFVANGLPSFWSQKVSKSFSSFRAERQGAVR